MSDTSETNSVDRATAINWEDECERISAESDDMRRRLEGIRHWLECDTITGEPAHSPTYSELEFQCKVQLREVERLQAVVADQALTIGALKDSTAAQACVIRDYGLENAKLQTLLSEERKLTAATAEYTTALERKVAELRESLRRIVGHLEYEARQGDGIAEDAYGDYSAAKSLLAAAKPGATP